MVKRKIKRGSVEAPKPTEFIGDALKTEFDSGPSLKGPDRPDVKRPDISSLPSRYELPSGDELSQLPQAPVPSIIKDDITKRDVANIDRELSTPDISSKDIKDIEKELGLPSAPEKISIKPQSILKEPSKKESTKIPAPIEETPSLYDRAAAAKKQFIETKDKWKGLVYGEKKDEPIEDDTYKKLYAYDSKDTDDLAVRGGYPTPKISLITRHKSIAQQKSNIETERNEIQTSLDANIKRLSEYTNDEVLLERLKRKQGTTVGLTKEEQEQYDKVVDRINNPLRNQEVYDLRVETSKLKSELDVKNKEVSKYDMELKKVEDEFGKHREAAQIGLRKEGFKQKFLKPLGEATHEMLEMPKVRDVSKQVGYGGLRGEDIEGGINTLFGGYRISSTAGEWAKTKVGDRGLVESLVKVTPSGMITPFGAPGTIQHSTLGTQFDYGVPLKRIGVSDVVARPGYRLTPEDIKRKKTRQSKPVVIRKKKKNIIKKVSAVHGSLSINVPITKSQLNSSAVIAKAKSPSVLTIGDGMIKSKQSSININITPFTNKDFDIGINTISTPLVKKKWLKVKI